MTFIVLVETRKSVILSNSGGFGPPDPHGGWVGAFLAILPSQRGLQPPATPR